MTSKLIIENVIFVTLDKKKQNWLFLVEYSVMSAFDLSSQHSDVCSQISHMKSADTHETIYNDKTYIYGGYRSL